VPPFRVVLTGSECTGKTTLARTLARRFRAPWSGEYVRAYAEALERPLAPGDVPAIARGQVAGEEVAIARAGRLALHDTDLLSTVVYSRHYFGRCPPEIEQQARERRADLYLLHHPDVDWIADGALRDRPHARAEIHDLFAAALRDLGARVVDVCGSWEERTANAVRAVEACLGTNRESSG
jgi:NadR type nicotinamide-nucleotide adenylyltransferase